MSQINMNKLTQNIGLLAAAAIFGSVITFIGYSLFSDTTSLGISDTEKLEKKPIYWVAPMDANYKRDKSGKSPMGMDLIPVYDNAGSGVDFGVGTIKISPEVVNNLGVRTMSVEYGTLHSKISTVGYVKYDEDQLIHIHPRVEGWVEKLYVKSAGDTLVEGQALYEIYSPALVNAQQEFLLALGRKNQRLILAAENRLKALQLPLRTIKQLKKNRKVKQSITFYAPQSGVVDNLNIREGFFVKPGTTLMSIGKLDQVWVEAEVFERQAAEVAAGIPVTMTLAYLPGKEWSGKVDYVYPILNAKTRTVKVRLRFDNKSKALKPNMFAQVVMHLLNDENSLLIPKEAVIRSGRFDRVVLALGDGRFKSIKVKIGRYDEDSAEILSGLDVGDRVVTSAQFLLDSESSKTSDFMRMAQREDSQADRLMNSDPSSSNSVTVNGVINSVMVDHRMLNISREAIEAWGREAATLDFIVSEAIDLSNLTSGMKVQFTFHLAEGEFVISDIQPDMQSLPTESQE